LAVTAGVSPCRDARRADELERERPAVARVGYGVRQRPEEAAMRGRVPGRPTKWIVATVNQRFPLGKPGVTFEVWRKWKKVDKKMGTLTVSVGGVRWLTSHGKKTRRRSWAELRDFLEAD
jgi:hypothetical protein